MNKASHSRIPQIWAGAVIVLFLLSHQAFSQSPGPNKRFHEFDMQPEVWHQAGPREGQVDGKGDLSLSLPILTVPGTPGRDFQINFSYKAGIKYHQNASWIGLGWNFDPGSITRDVIGNLAVVNTTYGVDFENPQTWDYAPDTYYLTVPGHGTVSFLRTNKGIICQDPNIFIGNGNFLFEEYRPWRIEKKATAGNSYNWWQQNSQVNPVVPSSDVFEFTITTDDGVRYVYGLPTLAYYKDVVGGSTAPYPYPNSWRLLAIAGPDYGGPISILTQTETVRPDYATAKSYVDWIIFEYENSTGDGAKGSPVFDGDELSKGANNNINKRLIQNTYLKWITTPTHRAKFDLQARQDGDLQHYMFAIQGGHNVTSYYKSLAGIKLYSTTSGQEQLVKQVVLNHDYSLAHAAADASNPPINGRLTLTGIQFKDAGGATLPGYSLQYVSLNPNFYYDTAGYDYDGYGYYNSTSSGGKYQGIDDDSTDGKAWSLEKITFPSGATEKYSYGNDYISDPQIGFNYTNNNGTSYLTYDFAAARHQGGTRVRSITRTEPLSGKTYLSFFTYYGGHSPSLPPKAVPVILEGLTGGQWPDNEYQAYNRGGLDVVYDKIIKTHIDRNGFLSAKEIRYYDTFVNVSQSNGTNTWILRTGPAGQSSIGYRLYTDNQTHNWGRLWKREIEHPAAGLKQTVEYTYMMQAKGITAALLFKNSAGIVEIGQFYPDLLQEKTTWSSLNGSGPTLQTTTSYNYSTNLRQVKKKTTTTSDKTITEDLTYLHEDPLLTSSDQTQIKQYNLLAPVTRRTVKFKDQSPFWQEFTTQQGPIDILQSASVTTYASSPPFGALFGPGNSGARANVWKVAKQYRLKRDFNTNNSLPPFPGPDWQLQFEALEYRYGQLFRSKDANGNELKIYYGDNGNPLDETVNANNFGRAYVTAVRANNGLLKQFRYDTQFMQVNKITDENGIDSDFTYDSFGRLQSSKIDGNIISDYAYHFPLSYNQNDPNYVRSTLHYSANSATDTYEYYDGRAQKRQTVIDADPGNPNDKNLITAIDLSVTGQTITDYKTYESPPGAPAYDPNYAGNATKNADFSYVSLLDSRLMETKYSMDPSKPVTRSYSIVMAKDINVLYGDQDCGSGGCVPGNTIETDDNWLKITTTDENGNVTISYQNETGQTILQQQFLDGNPNNTNVNNVLITHFQYDGAGNLLAVRPPNFFKPQMTFQLVALARTDYITRYGYNTLNQLVQKTTPDAGQVDYIYDANGNLRFVQDANGKAGSYFIYFKYDDLDRKVEEGICTAPGGFTQANADDPTYPTTNRSVEVSFVYDDCAACPANSFGTQNNLKGRLAYINYAPEQNFGQNGEEFYSYDSRGNIEWLVKLLPYDNVGGKLQTRMDYTYDLQNNVTRMDYQALAANGPQDLFTVWFEYDQFGRLSRVFSNTDGGGQPFVPEAVYSYLPTGQPQRLEFFNKLQGMDYAYNLRDWLVQINHPDLTPAADPGNDGSTGRTYYYKVSGVDNNGFETMPTFPTSALFGGPPLSPGNTSVQERSSMPRIASKNNVNIYSETGENNE